LRSRPALAAADWPEFAVRDAQPSGLRFRLFSFAVNALPDALARRPADCLKPIHRAISAT
jgi:hypothetical protein